MKTIQLKTELSDEEVDKLGGTFLNDIHYDLLVQNEDVKILKPDGTPLIVFRSKVLPANVCKAAFPALRGAASGAMNRGMAGGIIPGGDAVKIGGQRTFIKASDDATRAKPIKKDGTISNTSYSVSVPSGIIGYYDRYPRIPFCRLTAFNLSHPEKFAQAIPYIRAINAVFKADMPDRYAAQLKMIRKTSQDFVINKTAFTTVTVNKNWRTACHKDAGDLREGFGVMSALRAGKYKGCYLIFPKYRVAVDMQTRDVCLADVHSWHGNSPLIGVEGMYERLSTVLYYRAGMIDCGTAKEEQERAKALGIRAGKGAEQGRKQLERLRDKSQTSS